MQNSVTVKTKETRFPVAEDLYGLFFEDINRSGDGGLYPEMLRNRSFEDSLTPGGCRVEGDGTIFKNRGGWPGAFNHGEGMDGLGCGCAVYADSRLVCAGSFYGAGIA